MLETANGPQTVLVEGSWLLALVVLLPLAGAAVLAAGGRRLSRRAVAWIGIGAVGLAFGAALGSLIRLAMAGSLGVPPGVPPSGEGAVFGGLHWGGPAFWLAGRPMDDHGISLGLLGDGLSVWFALIVTGVGLLIHAYSAGYMAEDPHLARFFAELNYFVFAMSLLVLSDGLLGMLIGWANVGLASYLLIGFWHQRPDARSASMKAFVVTLTGELGILLATALLWSQAGTVNFLTLFERLPGLTTEALTAAGLLLLWGAVAKSAQLPLHVWLPDAMAGPTPVSALIHAATMVTAGVYLTARMYPIYQLAPVAAHAVAWVGAASALFGALVAAGQTDIKRVLAYSTMSQIGYMFVGVGVLAGAAGVFHFFTHAFFKALLFLAAGMVIHYLHGEQDLRRMGGLGGRLPMVYWAYLAGVLALTGVPPFAGYFSKEAILEAAWEHGGTGLWAAGVVAAGLTGFYAFRMMALVFAGSPAPGAPVPGSGGPAGSDHGGHGMGHAAGERRAWQAMAWPVGVLAVLALASGWVWVPGRWEPGRALLGQFFDRYTVEAVAATDAAGVAVHGMPGWAAWLPLVLVALAFGAAVWCYGPARGGRASRIAAPEGVARAWLQGFYVDAFYHRVLVQPLRQVSRWLERVVETEFVDGGVNGMGALAGALSAALRRVQQGYVRRYALLVLGGAVVVVAWALMGA